MSLVIIISNTLLLRGDRYKEAYIHQGQDMVDGAVMELLAPCRGSGAQRIGRRRLDIWVDDGQLGRW